MYSVFCRFYSSIYKATKYKDIGHRVRIRKNVQFGLLAKKPVCKVNHWFELTVQLIVTVNVQTPHGADPLPPSSMCSQDR
jgi:hypothetical protein